MDKSVTPRQPVANKYHEHLDSCQQCRDHPLRLCSKGWVILQAESAGLYTKALEMLPGLSADTFKTKVKHEIPPAWGIVCNHKGGKHCSAGAKCWIAKVTGAMERFQFLVKHRKTRRLVRLFLDPKLTRNYRAVWVPLHLRNKMATFDDQNYARGLAKQIENR